jgi:outer membrane protein assembly factor BamB
MSRRSGSCGPLGSGVALVALATVGCGGDDGSGLTGDVVDLDGRPGLLVVVDGAVWTTVDQERLDEDRIVRLDAGTSTATASVVVGSLDGDIAAVGDRLWVETFGWTVVEPVGASVVTDLPEDPSVRHHDVVEVGGRVYASRDGLLVELDPVTAVELAIVPTEALAVGGSSVAVLDGPMLAVDDIVVMPVSVGGREGAGAIDPATGDVRWRASVGRYRSAVHVGDVVWFLDRERRLTGVDVSTGDEVADVRLPGDDSILDSTEGTLAAGPDGSLWSLDQPEQMLRRLDPNTGEILGTWELRDRPTTLAVTDDAVWIANGFDEAVTTIDRADL